MPKEDKMPGFIPGQYSKVSPGIKDKLIEKFSTPIYAYPSDIKKNMHLEPFVHIRVVDPFTKIRKSKFALGLPMPASMRVLYNSMWEEITMNHLNSMVAENLMAGEKLNSISGFRSKLQELTSSSGKALEQAGLGTLGDFARAGGDFFGANVGAQAQIGAGIAVNPHAAMLFSNMAFREFQLRFVLMAKSNADDKAIDDIIFQLKYCMHPDFGEDSALGHTYYDIPENFILNFFGPNMHTLVKTHPCALIGIDIEYNGAGVPVYFSQTHQPVCIVLSLHFKELAVVTKKDIARGW